MSIDPLYQYIGNRIGIRRAEWFMSRDRLGELIGMGTRQEKAIQNIESGKIKIDLRRLYTIAEVLQCGLPYLLPAKLPSFDGTSSDDLDEDFNVGTKVTPMKGDFKGKVGTIIEKKWSMKWVEYHYLVRFARATYMFREDELCRAEEFIP